MTDPSEDSRNDTREPIFDRDRDNDEIIMTFAERPRPDFTLDPFHKVLLAVSMIIAVVVPVYFFLVATDMQGQVPMQYDFTGDVTREGSVREAAITLAALSALTIGCGVLTRYPRIFNFPVMLTRKNVQRQYRNAVQMMVWIVAIMTAILTIMVCSWLGILGADLVWLPLAAVGITLVVFIRRMFKLR